MTLTYEDVNLLLDLTRKARCDAETNLRLSRVPGGPSAETIRREIAALDRAIDHLLVLHGTL